MKTSAPLTGPNKPLRAADGLWLVGLALGGAWIWRREPGCLATPAETLPILAALALLAWFGAPWRLQPGPFRLGQSALAVAGVALVAGLLSDLMVLLALAWTALLWAWLRPRLLPDAQPRARRLLPLAVLAFPWLHLDLPSLGWWYRLSAAWTAEFSMHLLGLAVRREGTQLFVQQLPFDVTPACSGMQTLQALLVAGSALCFLQVGARRFYWFTLAFLPLVAWFANTVRVLLIIVLGLSFGPEFASGWFHMTGGWLVLVVMFGLTWLGLAALRQLPPQECPA